MTLRCIRGRVEGEELRFDGRATCLLGRSPDCQLRVPDDRDHSVVSRHHCLLDINPPDIRVRDFGSLNGTYVNGRKIGQRDKGESPDEASRRQFPEYDLKNGDKVQVGSSVFQVAIDGGEVCFSCGRDLEEQSQREATSSDISYCNTCIATMETVDSDRMSSCACCGVVIEGLMAHRGGEKLCNECKSDPARIVKRISKVEKVQPPALEDYEIVRELGRGGMGAVYLAAKRGSDQNAAIKVLLPEVATVEGAKEMFLREARLTKALDHPKVVRLYEASYCEGAFFLALEYCEGGSADEYAKRLGGTIPVNEAALLAIQTLEALEYTHRVEIPDVEREDGERVTVRGIVHRDIKPKNIFMRRRDDLTSVKVGDFGLAKAFDLAGLSGQTMTGRTCGSPYYMPRQQVINFKYAEPQVDLWAVAASFYKLVTGAYPRDFPRRKDPWHTVLTTQPVPIRKRLETVPKRLAGVIDAALQDEPELRFRSARELREELEASL